MNDKEFWEQADTNEYSRKWSDAMAFAYMFKLYPIARELRAEKLAVRHLISQWSKWKSGRRTGRPRGSRNKAR